MINITDSCVNILRNFNFENIKYDIPHYIFDNFNETYKKKYEYEKIIACNLEQKKILRELINDNKYMSEEIKKNIIPMEIYCEIIKYENISINCIFPHNENENENRNIDYNILIHICLFYKKLTKDNKNILIYIYYGNELKKYPNDNVFTEHHINSGLTYRSDENTFLFIWRKEEIIKVLFHELVHYFKIDYSDEIYKVKETISDIFNINGRDAPSESYTEILATIFNCVFCSLYFRVDVGILINFEIQFSNFQITKTLNNMSASYDRILQISNDKIYICQKTNFVSYFFVKNIIINNLHVFLTLIKNNIFFSKIIDQYCELIRNKIYVNHTYINNNNHKQICVSSDVIIRNTLRMSCVEYDLFEKIIN